jgi:hypothetical protein
MADFENVDNNTDTNEETSGAPLWIGVVGGVLLVALVVSGVYYAYKNTESSPEKARNAL